MSSRTATPPPEPRLSRYQRWLADQRGLRFASYDALWQWSVTDLPAFWQSIWDHFDLCSPTPHSVVLDEARMPGARWFVGAQVNYTQQVLRHAGAAHAAGHPAVLFADEPALRRGELHSLSWPELQRQVASLALALRGLGVGRGDRVCAVLPNTPTTLVAFLATASLGAIWSVCSPDMGPVAVLDRFRQIEPAVLIAGDGYHFGGQDHDRRAVLAELLAGLPSVRHLVLRRSLGSTPETDPPALAAALTDGRSGASSGAPAVAHDWATLTARDDADTAAFQPEWLPFDHPLWVVYSSGTTGLPKPIVHGHGGVMIEGLKAGALHNNVGATVETGDRFHWYSSTGWIMWNSQTGALLGGTTVCMFDGSPAAPAQPGGPADWSTLWRFAALSGATFFGAGAAFYASCEKAGVVPMAEADLSRLRAIGSTGSPLSDASYRWIWANCPTQADGAPIWIATISGGTDFAGAFVAGLATHPVIAGEMQCRCLGAAVQAFSEDGQPLLDTVGELVCTQPMPSMPLYLWGDTDGRRLHDSYFDMYPGVWRHGDWIKLTSHPELGAVGAIIYGRSDATINRHGIRMGTAELYRAVEALPELLDSLVVDLEYLGRESWMPLFVVLREGLTLDDALTARIKAEVRTALSPRHVPNDVFQVPAIPRTLSGKKMELPVKKLLMGTPADTVMKRDAMANAHCVDWFIALAAQRLAAAATTSSHSGTAA